MLGFICGVLVGVLGMATASGAVEIETTEPQPVAEAASVESRSGISPDASSKGYTFGDTGLWVGGYLHTLVEFPESGDIEAELEDVGILVRYEPTPRLSFFGEGEIEDTIVIVEGEGLGSGDNDLSLQRLFADYLLGAGWTARLGKFLTPFGIWNPMRRAPLTWTVERPIITETAFPAQTTGPALVYKTTAKGWTLDALIYGQATNELVRRTDDKSASELGGARFAGGHSVGSGFLDLGLNVVTFDDRETDVWETSVGADASWNFQRHQLTTEAALLAREGPNEWGLYVQDVVQLIGTLFGVLRYEHFDLPDEDDVDGLLLGFAWRPRANVVFKLNYQLCDQETDSLERGALAAVALSF